MTGGVRSVRAHVLSQGENGSTLLELLFAACLLTIVGSAVLLGARQQLTVLRRLTADEQALRNFRVTAELIGRGFAEARSRLGIAAHRISFGGALVDMQNGSAVFQNERFPPAPHSAVLTFLHIASPVHLRVAEAQGGMVVACDDSEEPRDPDGHPTEHWIAVGVDGYVQAKGKLRSSAQNRACGRRYRGTLSLASPQIFAHLPSDERRHLAQVVLERPKVLLPIKELYSIYLDREGTLRRRSHLSTESQPLMRSVSEFVLECPPGSLLCILQLAHKEAPTPFILRLALNRPMSGSFRGLL